MSAFSFAANMALRKIALDYAESHPQVAQAALDAFYVDDGLMGADSVEEAIRPQSQHSSYSNLEDLCYGCESRVGRLF